MASKKDDEDKHGNQASREAALGALVGSTLAVFGGAIIVIPFVGFVPIIAVTAAWCTVDYATTMLLGKD